MARQVNKRFVLLLSIALAALIVLLTGVYVLQVYHKHDPRVLIPQADEALKQGDIDGAINYLTMALPRARSSHMVEVPQLYLRIGDLYYQTSRDGPRYKSALDFWQAALIYSPKYKDAIDRLFREHYQLATNYAPDWWATVEKDAGLLIDIDPTDGIAYGRRAEAILRQAIKDESVADERQASAEKDLLQAIKLRPKDASAYSMLMQLDLYRAAAADRRGKKSDRDEAKRLRESAKKTLSDFCAANPSDPEGHVAMAQLEAELKDPDAALKELGVARQIAPNLPKVYEAYEGLYRFQNKIPEMLDAIKKIIALQPENLGTYVRLAHAYEEMGDPVQALQYYEDVFSRKAETSGIITVQNEEAQSRALFLLPLCYLEAAEQVGPSTPKGKTYLDAASDGTEKLRQRNGANTPLVNLLDGRNAYLKNQLQQAIPLLRRADDGLVKASPQVWFTCKLLLADAYAKQTEYGTSMKYVDDILQQYPGNMAARQRRVSLLLHVARYDDALHGAQDILKESPNNSAALQLEVSALQGLGRYADAQEVLGQLKLASTDSLPATLQMAQMQLFRNEPQDVVETLAPALDAHPDNDKGLLLMSLALIKLDRKAEARTYLTRGLEKYPDNVQMQMLLKTLDQPSASLETVQRQVIDTIPDAFERDWALSQFYAGKDDYPNELKWLKECEKIKSDSDVVIDRIFTLALRQKDWVLADQYSQRAASLNLDGVSGKLFQGRLEYAKGDKDQGIATLRSAVAQRDDYSMAWTVLGQAYADMQNTSEAITALQTAVSEKPDNIYALKTLIALYINQHDDSSVRMAVSNLTSAMHFAPRDPQLRVFEDLVGNPQNAIQSREESRRIDPKNAENLRRLAVLYTKNNQLEKAISTLEDLFSQHPDDLSVADALGRLYRDQGRTNDALKIYEPFLLSKDPDVQFRSRILLGDMHRSLSQVSEAISLYNEASKKEKDNGMEAQRRLADMYFELDDMPHAQELYQTIYKTEASKDIRVLRRYIETLIRQDQFDAATSLLDSEVLKDRPDDPEGLVLRGYALLRQHKAREALDSFEKVLDTSPDNTDALHYRAFTNYTLMNNHQAAINDLLHIRSQAPNAVNSRLLLARIYFADKQFPEAAHEYQEILSLRPEMGSVRLEYAQMLLGITQLSLRMPKDKEDPLSLRIRAVKPVDTLSDLLTDSIHRFPTQGTWPIMLGNLYGMTGNGDQAVAVHKAAFLSSGKSLPIGLTYINTLINVHRFDEAINVIDDLAQLNASVELDILRGKANAALGHKADAGGDFNHAADLTKDVDTTVRLARECVTALGGDASVQLFQQRMAKNPKDFLGGVALAVVYSSTDNPKAAIQQLSSLIGDPQAASAKPLLLRMSAMANYQLKAFDKALGYYQRLLQLQPDDLEALNNIAYLLADDLKRPEEAMKYAMHARQIIEDQPVESSLSAYSNVMDTVGWVRFLADDMDGATDDLQKSLQMDPLPICYYHIANLYAKQHRSLEAREAAQQSILLGTTRKDPVVARAQALLDQLKVQ
jgi:tetratricopeptide (TPR) repeat protein